MRRHVIATTLAATGLVAMTIVTVPAVAARPASTAGQRLAAATPAVVATIDTGAQPTDLVLDPSKALLYVLDAVTPRVVVISTTSNTVVGTIDVAEGPMYLTLDTPRNQLFVANGDPTLGPGSLSVIDTDTNTLTSTITLVGNPRRPVLDSRRGLLYVAQTDEDNGPGTLATIDAKTNSVSGSRTIGVSPGDPALDAARRRLYVPLASTVAVYDTRSIRQIAAVKVGQFPDFLVLDPLNRQFFAVKLNGLVVVDARTNKVKASIRMPIAIDEGPPAIDAARHRMYIPSWPYRGRIAVLDTRTYKVKARITVGIAPDGPVIDTDRRRLYVPEFDEGNGHSVFVIDTATNKVIDTVDVGKGPQTPALDQASGRLYVPSWVSGTVTVVDALLSPRTRTAARYVRVSPLAAEQPAVRTRLLVPGAALSSVVPLQIGSKPRWYEGRTGTVQWALGSEFMQQLTDAGAELRFCTAAKVAVDKGSGVGIVTLPVYGNSAIQLNGRESGLDATSDCAITITGSGATVEFTKLYFNVSSASPSGIGASLADESTDLGSGARKKLPKQATRNKITVTSPVILMDSSFGDVLRGALNPATGLYEGPVPTMTAEPVNLGVFQLAMKVKTMTRPPLSSGNSEG